MAAKNEELPAVRWQSKPRKYNWLLQVEEIFVFIFIRVLGILYSKKSILIKPIIP